VCCSVLQCVAVCCSVLQCVAVCRACRFDLHADSSPVCGRKCERKGKRECVRENMCV